MCPIGHYECNRCHITFYSYLSEQKEPREPIYLYEPTAEFSSTQQDDFPPPRRGGHNFRGGMDGGRVSCN